jgi:ubiquinone/menaquinone biosynthesis C-methylase UbiE
MASTTVSAPNPSAIFGTLRGFQESAALGSAIDLEVFTAIAEGAVTSAQIAGKSGASERGIRILCDTLVTSGMLTKQGERYGNTQDTQIFLNRHSAAYMGGVKEFLCSPEIMTELLTHLTESVRRGGTSLPGDGSVNPDNPIWVTFARVMAPMMVPAAHAIASHIPATGPLKVLDIAAGHGLFGITVAQRNPEAEIVALDWKAVLEVAKENAAKAGVDARYSTIAGSAFDVDFGTGYDVVLVTNFLHHFDAPMNETLLRKVHAALKPGGRAVTLEFVPNDDRVTPAMPARFALTMLSTTQRGDAYTFKELDAMYRNAGFSESVCHVLETQQSVIISTK